MIKSVLKTLFLSTVLGFFVTQLCLPTDSCAQDAEEKKKQEILKKLQELKEKKMKIQQETQSKISKQKSSQPQKSLDEIIAKYESLHSNCSKTKSERCADVMYTLSKLYYDKARDDYIKARQEYEKAMDKWERNPQGPEPVNPVPDYSKALQFYRNSIKEYPDFEKADEGYYQIGSICMIIGEVDESKEAFTSLVTKLPNSIRASAAHFRLAEFCFMDRDFTCALKHIERIKENEINPEVQEMAHYRKAEIYYNRAEFDKAADLFFNFVEKCDRGEYPKRDLRNEALEYLAICFSDMPDGAEKAIELFKSVGKRPYEDYVIYTVGMKNFNHGQYEQAASALKTALDKYPYYIEAPLAQQMIVSCYVIRKKYEEANEEREKLVERYSTGSEWITRNMKDPVAIEKASNEVKRALAAIPIYYHVEAQKKKSKALYEKALARYQQYISTFPSAKWKVYEFKYNMAEIYNSLHEYEKAAESYDYVATQDLSTYPKFVQDWDTLGMEQEEIEKLKKEKSSSPVAISQEDAGYNAIVALDNLRKKIIAQQSLTDEQAYARPETIKFLQYIESFQTKFPSSSNAPEVLYLAGNVHYLAKAYDAAITTFQKIISTYSKTQFSSKALRMLAKTYTSSGQFNLALSNYKQLLAQEKPNTNEYNEIVDLAAVAMFQNANAKKKAGDLQAAAEAFKRIFDEFPNSNSADRGWFEAAACYEEMQKHDLAAKTFKELGNKFPKSTLLEKSYVRAAENYKKLDKWPEAAAIYELAAVKIPKEDYAIPSLSSAAECYQNVKMYDKAGKMYEIIMEKYPADKRTPLAIYNGGLVYEKGKLYAKAIELYTLLGTKYTDSEYAAEGYYSIGFCYEKMGKNNEMAQAFSSYAEKFTENRSKQVEALVRASEAYIKMKNFKEAEKNAELAINIYEKFKKKSSIDLVAASKAYYTLGEIRQNEFNDIKLKGRRERDVQNKLKAKTKALEPVLKAYGKAIEIGVSEWTIRSTYMIAQCFIDFAVDIRDQSLFGNKDQQIAGKINIISGLEKYYMKAMEKLYWVINTAYEQNIQNEWVEKSKEQFISLAYKKGYLFEEIGIILKNAPIPRGLSAEETQVYKDVLEEKYLEAMDAALPKYEEGVKAASELGLINNPWLDSLRARISFINPQSEALTIQVQARAQKTPANVSSSTVTPSGTNATDITAAAPTTAKRKDERLERNLRRIANIMEMNISVEEKIKQLRSIESDARREIQKEESLIEEILAKLKL